MNTKTMQAIIKYIKGKDPDHDVVELKPKDNLSGGTIVFSSSITQHRKETLLKGEKYAEAYLLVKLAKELNYPVHGFELQKEYPVGHPKTDRPRIDIIANHLDDSELLRRFFFIEVKDPDKFESEREDAIQHQLYLLADHERIDKLKYLVYYSVELVGKELADKIDIIDFEQFEDFEAWNAAGRPTLDLIPKEYGLARKAVYVNKELQDLSSDEKTLDKSAGPDLFTTIRRDLHDVLWGGGGMFYNEIFSNLVRIFLAKIYDEETTSEDEAYRFQVQMVGEKPESPSSVYQRVNGLFQDAQRHYLGYSEVQAKNSRGIDTEKISENKIAYAVERLQGLSLIENENKDNNDVLGAFFEGIVEQGFKQSRGQFFTHINIVHFLIQALDISKIAIDLVNGVENPANPRLPFICDPACGSGAFLIESMKLITKEIQTSPNLKQSVRNRQFIESMFPPSKPNRWADIYAYGVEINSDLSLATKVNMVLHGDGNINIYSQDGLAPFEMFTSPEKISALKNSHKVPNYPYKFDVNEQFDFVLSNPPFSIKPDDETKKEYKKHFEFGNNAKSENLFLERWFQLLKEGGKIGVVLPESVFDTPTGKNSRLFLYRYFKIDAVIALPYLAFKPYTSTKTCLLIATKKTQTEVHEFDRHWKKSRSVVGKALRRISAFSKSTDSKEQERILKLLKKDAAPERNLLANLLGAKNKEPDQIYERLKMGAGAEVKPDATQLTFSLLAKTLDYEIFFADVAEVGYKRRKQGRDLERPNDLFALDKNGSVKVDRKNPQNVLDEYLSRKVSTPKLSGFLSRFSNIGDQVFLRCDPKYRWFWDHLKGKATPQSEYDYVPLSKFLSLAPKVTVKKGELPEERSLIELEDVESGTGRIIAVHSVDEVGSDKVEFGGSDIVFSKLEPYLCKAIINAPKEEYIGTTEWIPLIVSDKFAVRDYMWAFLISPIAREVFRLLQSGKRHARINMHDFKNILVPDVPKPEQEKLVKRVRPNWKRIEEITDELAEVRQRINETVEVSLSGDS